MLFLGRGTQKIINFFLAFYFHKVHLHHSSQSKIMKKSQNGRNQGFCYYFCLMMEESGSESESPSRSIRIREAQKHTNPANPDLVPEHCIED
jgi:hypothetical protein